MKKEKLNIIYEDKYLVVVNKKAGVLTVSTDKEKEKTLFHELINYEKTKNKNNKIFVIHRLDKDTSGLVMFAKDQKTQKLMQEAWEKVTRKYVALVYGFMKKDRDTLEDLLAESKGYEVFITNNPKYGKKAITLYEVIKKNKNFSLLDIEIKTGRKHQIRVQLNSIGHPIVGDRKYSNKPSPLRNMALHAYLLEFTHPYTKKLITLKMAFPKVYDNLI